MTTSRIDATEWTDSAPYRVSVATQSTMTHAPRLVEQMFDKYSGQIDKKSGPPRARRSLFRGPVRTRFSRTEWEKTVKTSKIYDVFQPRAVVFNYLLLLTEVLTLGRRKTSSILT